MLCACLCTWLEFDVFNLSGMQSNVFQGNTRRDIYTDDDMHLLIDGIGCNKFAMKKLFVHDV